MGGDFSLRPLFTWKHWWSFLHLPEAIIQRQKLNLGARNYSYIGWSQMWNTSQCLKDSLGHILKGDFLIPFKMSKQRTSKLTSSKSSSYMCDLSSSNRRYLQEENPGSSHHKHLNSCGSIQFAAVEKKQHPWPRAKGNETTMVATNWCQWQQYPCNGYGESHSEISCYLDNVLSLIPFLLLLLTFMFQPNSHFCCL